MRASIVFGLVNGLNYALLAVGLVLVFKAGRFVNFAHAQMGVLSALLLGKMVLDWGAPWIVSFVAAVATGVAIGALVEWLVIRRLDRRSPMSRLIASIGVAQVLLAMTFWTWLGPDRVELTNEGYPLPFQTRLHIDHLTLGAQHVLTAVTVPVIAVALTYLLRATATGKAIRAVAANRDAAELAGIRVAWVARTTWMLAGGLAAVSAVLAAPGQASFDTEALGPSLMLRAIGAAALGGFTSLPAGAIAGVSLGVVEAIVLHATGDTAVATAWLFALVLAGLVVRSRAIERASGGSRDDLVPTAAEKPVPSALRDRFVVKRRRLLLAGVALYVAIVAPWIPAWRTESTLFILATTLVVALVAVSLTIVTGWSGQVSLGQFAFVGIGAFVGARMLAEGWSLTAAIAVAAVAGAVAATLVGLPALRVPGLTLAVSTMGLAVVAPAWLFRQTWFIGEHTTLLPAPRLGGVTIDSQRSTYYVVLATLCVVLIGASRVRRAAPGRMLVAVRDNERASASLGVSPTAVKLAAFAASGAIAALAGVLWITAWRSASIDAFPSQQSLVMLSVAVIGGITSLAGAVVGAVVVYGVPALTHDWVRSITESSFQLQLFLGGIGLVVTQVVHPGGLAHVVGQRWSAFLDVVDRQVDARTRTTARTRAPALEVVEARVAFGGIDAVDGVTLHVDHGEIVGLIGTNGAGKTTLLNAISGIVPARGSIRVNGAEIGSLSAAARARVGIGRSFQDARLFAGLTVREAIQLALGRRHRIGLAATVLGAPWARPSETRSRRRADDIIAAVGLEAWADVPTGELSTGTRRICDLAIQLASEPSVLLLDEPTAGVAQRDAEQLAPLLRRVVSDLGCAVLLIEHDMPLLLGVADRVYCLDQGRVIAEGTADGIRDDPRVVASYLGTDDAAINRSSDTRTTPVTSRTRRGAPLRAMGAP